MKIHEPRLTFLIFDGKTCPFFICAACGQRLEQPGRQMIAWDMTREGAGLQLYPIHKPLDGRTCLDDLEHWIEKVQGGYMGTTELADFLGQLMHNTGYQVPGGMKLDGFGDFYHLKPRRKSRAKRNGLGHL